MSSSLSHIVDKISEINKKLQQSKNKYIDNFKTMLDLLSHSIDNLSVINKKVEKSENKFIVNFRTILASLSHSVDKISENNKKLSLIELTEKFPNTNQLCNKDLNKFELLLRKGVYPYEYMDNWKRFNDKSLPNKEHFYSELNKEGITNENYKHAQKVWKELADGFENFRNI